MSKPEFSDLVPQTAEQEERALLIESERQTARNMCHGLFGNSKTAVRSDSFWKNLFIFGMFAEHVTFHSKAGPAHKLCPSCWRMSWTRSASISHISYEWSVMWMIGCTDHQEVHQRVHQAVASWQVQTKDGPQDREGRVFWGHGKSNLCCSGTKWVWNGKMILECFIFVTSAWVNYYIVEGLLISVLY